MAVINLAYYISMTERVNKINECADLQVFVDEAMQSILDEKNALIDQIAQYAPMLELLTVSFTDIGSVISFLENFITAFLTPYLKPYITMSAELVALVAQIAELVAAIEAAAGRIPSCSITIPT